jgi:hypothetical protein
MTNVQPDRVIGHDVNGDIELTDAGSNRRSMLKTVALGAAGVTAGAMVFSNVNGTPLASGNITNTGNRGPSGGNYGHLQVVRGAPVLTFTTQPSPSATGGVDFATQPVVHVEDRFGTDRPNDSVTLSITRPGLAIPP